MFYAFILNMRMTSRFGVPAYKGIIYSIREYFNRKVEFSCFLGVDATRKLKRNPWMRRPLH
jgi:hypothetical protein